MMSRRRERSLLTAEKIAQELRHQMSSNAFDSERLLTLLGQWIRVTGKQKWQRPKIRMVTKIHS